MTSSSSSSTTGGGGGAGGGPPLALVRFGGGFNLDSLKSLARTVTSEQHQQQQNIAAAGAAAGATAVVLSAPRCSSRKPIFQFGERKTCVLLFSTLCGQSAHGPKTPRDDGGDEGGWCRSSFSSFSWPACDRPACRFGGRRVHDDLE
mmetsp:Transcript_16886/g.22694  ORF Transcript_16886/g.22694 Transcript_16886/m.22694 type:complete len:147 (-) Transcript_16886:10-450(-)